MIVDDKGERNLSKPVVKY